MALKPYTGEVIPAGGTAAPAAKRMVPYTGDVVEPSLIKQVGLTGKAIAGGLKFAGEQAVAAPAPFVTGLGDFAVNTARAGLRGLAQAFDRQSPDEMRAELERGPAQIARDRAQAVADEYKQTPVSDAATEAAPAVMAYRNEGAQRYADDTRAALADVNRQTQLNRGAGGLRGLATDTVAGITQMAPAAAVFAATRNPALAASTITAPMAGQYLADSLDKGMPLPQAVQRMAVMTGAEQITESPAVTMLFTPAKAALKEGAKSFAGKLIAGLGKRAGAEGAQEAVTQVLQDSYDAGVLDEHTTVGDVLKDAGYAGLIGAIVGGAVGLPHSVGDARKAGKPVPNAAFDTASEQFRTVNDPETGESVVVTPSGVQLGSAAEARAAWDRASPDERSAWMAAPAVKAPEALPAPSVTPAPVDPGAELARQQRASQAEADASQLYADRDTEAQRRELAMASQGLQVGEAPESVTLKDGRPAPEAPAPSTDGIEVSETPPTEPTSPKLDGLRELAGRTQNPDARAAIDAEIAAEQKRVKADAAAIEKQNRAAIAANELRQLADQANDDSVRQSLLARADKLSPPPSTKGIEVGEPEIEAVETQGDAHDLRDQPSAPNGESAGGSREGQRTEPGRAASVARVPGPAGTRQEDGSGTPRQPVASGRPDAAVAAGEPERSVALTSVTPTAEELGERGRKTLLGMIRNVGGINAKEISDITGERGRSAHRLAPALFKKDGRGIDDIATVMHEAGYLTDQDVADVDGDVEKARELIQAAIRKEPVVSAEYIDEYNRLRHEESLDAQEAADAVGADAAQLDDLSIEGLDPQSPADVLDHDLLARIRDEDEPAFERAAIKYEDDDAGLMAWAQEWANGQDRKNAGQSAEADRRSAPGVRATEAEGRSGKEALALTAQTEASRQDEARAAKDAQADEAKRRAAREDKAAADKERSNFALTGSDRAADVATAGGQSSLFGASAKSAPRETTKAAPVKESLTAQKPPTETAEKAKPAAKTESANQTTSPRATEDAGDELWYNRRNKTGKGVSWDDVQGLNAALKVKEAVKSKVWPRPDYEQLVGDGMSPLIAHVVKQVYDSISAKPKTHGAPSDEQIRLYIETIHRVRDAVFSWARDASKVGGWAQSIVETAQARTGKQISLGALSRPAAEQGIVDAVFPLQADQSPRSRFTGDPDNNKRALLIGGNKPISAMRPGLNEAVDAMKSISAGWPTPQESWQIQGYHIAEKGDLGLKVDDAGTGRSDYHVVRGQIGGRSFYESTDSKEQGDRFIADMKPFVVFDKSRKIIGSAETREAAADIARAKTKRESGGGSESEDVPLTTMVRNGVARREAGEDVTSDQLKTAFGFRGINFGNWMKGDGNANSAERQAHLNHAYDAFHDLAEVLAVPPKAMSLNGMLGIAFGAQGRGGGVAAHFVPGVNEINLTRRAGAGALAHEWGHALDHYFAVQAGEKFAKSSEPFISALTDRMSDAGIRPEVRDAFNKIVSAMNKRPLTAEEIKARDEAFITSTRRYIDRALKSLEMSLHGKAANEFAALADRARAGDLGDGVVEIRKPRTRFESGVAFADVIAQLRNLVKDTTGRQPSNDDLRHLEMQAKMLGRALNKTDADSAHIPQAATQYQRAANSRDSSKGGKAYWATPWEMFARAFESYAMDKLADSGGRNDYLVRRGKAEPTPEQAETLAQLGTPYAYPMGDERKTINAAFDKLVGTLKSRTEGDKEILFRAGRDRSATPQATADQVRVALDARFGKAGVQSLIDSGVLTVVQSVSDLPADLSKGVERAGLNAVPKGLYDRQDSKAYIIADNTAAADAASVLLHEVGEHYGLQRMLGENGYARLLDDIRRQKNFKGVTRDAWETVERNYPHLEVGSDRFIREVIAHAGETAGKIGWFQRIINAVRMFLRKIGITRHVSDNDIRGMVAKSLRQAMQEGRTSVVGQGVDLSAKLKPTEDSNEPGQAPGSSIPQTETPAFKKWFGDSKVVDENGKPLVVYHGTNADFDAFDPATVGKNFEVGDREGFFFSSGTAEPNLLAGGARRDMENGANVMPVFLSLENPLIVKLRAGESGNSATQYLDDHKEELMLAARDGKRDGIIVTSAALPDHPSHSTYVAFRPEQIKSAIGNRGTFDANDPRIDFSLASKRQQNPSPKGSSFPEEAYAERMARLFADKMNRVKKGQDIAAANGTRIGDNRDVYTKENLSYGKANHLGDQLEEKYLNPILKIVKASGLTLKQVDDYLYALHAPERNKVIASRNPAFPDGGSGMSNAEAAKVISSLNTGQRQVLDRIAGMVRQMQADKLKMMEDYGLLSAAEAQTLRSTYKNYVPLKTVEEDKDQFGVGQGFDVRGNEVKMAMGRGSRATSPLMVSFQDYSRAIVRSVKNDVGRALYDLAQDPAAKGVVEIANPADFTIRTTDAQGNVKTALDPNFARRDEIFATKVDGETQYVFVRDPLMLQQLKKLGDQYLPEFLNGWREATSLFGRLVTQYNPAFGPVNAFRDAIQASIFAMAQPGIEARKVLRDIPWAMSGIVGRSPTWEKLYNEFLEDGAATGAYGLQTIRDLSSLIEAEGIGLGSGNAPTNFKQMTAFARRAKAKLGRTWGARALEAYNEAFENATRLSVYANARRSGKTRQEAAFLSKEIGVNFNKKGEWTPVLNAMFVFFNAAMQGNRALLKFGRNPKVAAALGTLFAAGILNDVLGAAMGGDDDTGEKNIDEVNAFKRDHAIVLPTDDDHQIMLPLPYGLNVPFLMGRRLANAVRTGQYGTNMVGILSGIVDNFSPIGAPEPANNAAGAVAKVVTPTLMKPITELATNTNFYGGPIYKESSPYERSPAPHSENAFRSTTEVSKALSSAINRATGGDSVKPGALDIPPEAFDYLTGYYTGGVGKVFMQGVDLGAKLATGKSDDIELNKIPLLNRFAGNDSRGATIQRYGEIQKELEYAKDYAKQGQLNKVTPQERKVYALYDFTEKGLLRLRKARKEAMQAGNDTRVKQLDEAEQQAQARVVKAYNAAQ